jgi:hypothetical protein
VRAVTDASSRGLAEPGFRRVLAASTISAFGSFITRMAPPLVAIRCSVSMPSASPSCAAWT